VSDAAADKGRRIRLYEITTGGAVREMARSASRG
jgi:hypothetical protein